MFAQLTQIQPLTKIRRNRFLPVSGTVLVRVGQKVTPGEVIAETQVPTRHLMFDVFRSLGFKTPADAEKKIERELGDMLDKHDIIVETGGLFSRVIRTPMPGKIVSIKDGQVLLEVESRLLTVQAGMTGSVVEIVRDRGAVIESDGVLIQGVWGNELTGFGPFLADADMIDQELTNASLSLTSRGMVLAAAYCDREESLNMAATLPLEGLILGSLSPDLVPCAEQQPYPIILLEGFGKNGINEAAKNLLLTNSKRELAIHAVKHDRNLGVRPEITIALPAKGETAREIVEVALGQTVRGHQAPRVGQIGRVLAVHEGLTMLPNGLRAPAATIKFQNNEEEILPITNFDIIDLENRFLG